ncbi:hypothetical protein [Variovorax boronicumulans]|uniref:hypothetical protein n=1 Tax=Variovorax boronicumulans TaxID=436515 RepID=UPI003398A95F
MSLLEKLAAATLPCIEADPLLIDRLRVLQAASHIGALIPPVQMGCDQPLCEEAAIVFQVTPTGRQTLRTGAPPEPAHIDAWFSGTRRRSGA